MSQREARVYEATWPWRNGSSRSRSDGAEKPTTLRVICEVAAMTCVGLILRFVFDKAVVATIVFALAALVLIGGLLVPPLYRAFRKAGHGLAKGVGVALSWILLLPFFYICFPLGRLLLLLSRKDPMNRGFLPENKTYWSKHRPLPPPETYRRQY